MKILSRRNIASNLGAAVGPILGIIAIHLVSLKIFVIFASLIFLLLAMMVLNLPNLKPENKMAKSLTAENFNYRNLISIVGGIVLAVGIISADRGALIIQFDTLLPRIALDRGIANLVGLIFILNAILVILLQNFSLILIKKPLKYTIYLSCTATLGAFLILNTKTTPLLALIGCISLISLLEVIIVMRIDNYVRKLTEERITLTYGISGLADGLGGAIAPPIINSFYTKANIGQFKWEFLNSLNNMLLITGLLLSLLVYTGMKQVSKETA